jgi:uncharacterized membrane protein YfcA
MALPLVTGTDRASPTGPVVAAHPRKADGWLAHLPVSLFAAAMGIGGLSLVSPHVLLSAFAGLMFVVAVLMVRRLKRLPKTASGHVAGEAAAPLAHQGPGLGLVMHTVAAATAVGLLTGFFGVGGGFAVVPALVLALGFPMPAAVGTSLLVISINSATALIARYSTGAFSDVNWAVVGVFAAMAAAGSLLGARASSRVDERRLTGAFVVLLLAIAGYLAAVNLPQLA